MILNQVKIIFSTPPQVSPPLGTRKLAGGEGTHSLPFSTGSVSLRLGSECMGKGLGIGVKKVIHGVILSPYLIFNLHNSA